MAPEAHAFWQLLYVVRGNGAISLSEKEFSLQNGDAILLAPDTFHAIRDAPNAPMSLYAVNFAPHFFLDFDLAPRANRPLHHPTLGVLPDVLRRLLWEQSARPPGFCAMMSGLALQLLATLNRLESPSISLQNAAPSSLQTRVALYVTQLENEFFQAQSVESVAARLKMSRRHFTALFRLQTGDSWLNFLRKLRVQHAQKLLQSSSRTVVSVAFECGFEDLSAFYRAFKRETGLAPDAWRKNQREQRSV